MFVRKKKNRSGNVSMIVADKSSGRFKELKTIGISSAPDEIAHLEVKTHQWIDEYSGRLTLDVDESTQAIQEVMNTIARIERTFQDMSRVILYYIYIYERIGFGAISDSILRHLVIARVCLLQSMAVTAAYLKSYFDEDVRPHNIYRYMDRQYNTQRENVQQISEEHAVRILGGRIGSVFNDATTPYFEPAPDPDDELRQASFSKDDKMAE